jgi:hypothetical protein
MSPIFRKNRHVPKRSAARIAAVAAALCSIALAAASCSYIESYLENKKGGGVAEARIIVGDVSLSRSGASHPVAVGTKFMPHDVLVTGGASKVKISSGPINIFVNEMASFHFLPPLGADSCVIAVEKGAYYFFLPAGGRTVTCLFGDMTINVLAGTYASLAIDASGRLAEFFVLGGHARIRRGGEPKEVSSCEVVVLDAAGISVDSTVTSGRGAAIERLKDWVGETVIDKGVAQGMCKPGPEAASAGEPASGRKIVRRPAVNPVPGNAAKPGARPGVRTPPPDTAAKPAAPAQPAEGFIIEQIVGPRRIYSGEEFTLKCGTSGRAAVKRYEWKFDGVGELLISKTDVPQVTVKLEKTGEFLVTCDIVGDAGTLASQTVRINVVPGNVAINAGGPYNAMINKPVKMLGNANSRRGNIERYEWYVSNSGKPDYTLKENAAVSHTYTKSGTYKAVFTVRFADGSVAGDTATVNVGSLPPVAKAGADIMPKSNGKVKLKGTGSSPDGKIVKYEWDFDGDGVFDWSSESSGETEYAFNAYSMPVFRVTDAEGKTAMDTLRVVICPWDMAAVEKGKFCVDRYEWPNQRGVAPLTNISWHEAAKACESVGKRLCAVEEWKRACRNGGDKPADGNTYPYGDEYGENKCNTLGNRKSKNALMPAGALGECTGALGVYDMSGNAAEWTAPKTGKAQAFGGFYQSGPEESGCESGVTLDKGKKYLYTGFRCCK